MLLSKHIDQSHSRIWVGAQRICSSTKSPDDVDLRFILRTTDTDTSSESESKVTVKLILKMYLRSLAEISLMDKLTFLTPVLNPMNSLFLSVTRDGVIAVNRDTGQFTDEYLPEQRSHLYGITAVYPYCPGKQLLRQRLGISRVEEDRSSS